MSPSQDDYAIDVSTPPANDDPEAEEPNEPKVNELEAAAPAAAAAATVALATPLAIATDISYRHLGAGRPKNGCGWQGFQ
jgi:hypothetical protein